MSPRGAAAVLLVAAAFGWSVVRTGSDVGVVAQWLLTLGAGVMLPGTLLVRAVRSRGVRSDADLAWGAVAGLLLALATWALGHLVGYRIPAPLSGAAVSAALVALPRTRARLGRDRGHDSWGWPVWSAVVVSMLVVVRKADTTGLSWVPPHISATGPQLYPDLFFHVAMTGELRRTLVPDYPMVAGTPLSYHWLYYALAAELGGDGAHDLDVVLRLLPLTLLLVLLLVATAAAAALARRRSAAAAAPLLLGVAGPVGGTLWPGGGPPGYPDVINPAIVWPLQTYWQVSPTQTLGWVFGVASLGLAVAFVRGCPGDRGLPLWLLVPTLVGAAGAKSVQNPLLLAFLGGLGLAVMARRHRAADARPEARLVFRRAVLLAGTLVLVSLVMARLLYPDSYGLRLAPAEGVARAVSTVLPGWPGAPGPAPLSTALAAGLAAAGALVVRLGPTLLGLLGVLGLFRRVDTRAAGWGAMTMAAAALGGLLLLTQPGGSQWYFFIAATPLLATMAAAGAGPAVADAVTGHRGRLREWAPLLVAAGTGGAVTLAVSAVAGPLDPGQRDRSGPTGHVAAAGAEVLAWLLPPLGVGAGVALAVAGAVATAHLWRPRLPDHPRRPPTPPLAAACVAVAVSGALSGVALLGPDATPYPAAYRDAVVAQQTAAGVIPVTPALERAGALVRGSAGPDDIIATNRVYSSLPRGASTGDGRDFSVSALTGRRTDVAGFAYAPATIKAAADWRLSFTAIPFWDPARLEAEQRLITAPTPATLSAAYRVGGVRWIVADERSGPVSPRLARLAQPVFDDNGVHVYRLRPPAPG